MKKNIMLTVVAIIAVLLFTGCSVNKTKENPSISKLDDEKLASVVFDNKNNNEATKKVLEKMVRSYELFPDKLAYVKWNEQGKTNLNVYVMESDGEVFVVALKDIRKNYYNLYKSTINDLEGIVDNYPIFG